MDAYSIHAVGPALPKYGLLHRDYPASPSSSCVCLLPARSTQRLRDGPDAVCGRGSVHARALCLCLRRVGCRVGCRERGAEWSAEWSAKEGARRVKEREQGACRVYTLAMSSSASAWAIAFRRIDSASPCT